MMKWVMAALLGAVLAFGAPAARADDTSSLAGTRWHGSDTIEAGPPTEIDLYFRADGVLEYTYDDDTDETAHWRMRNALVSFEMNDNFVIYVGTIQGSTMSGAVYNKNGRSGTWTFTRQ